MHRQLRRLPAALAGLLLLLVAAVPPAEAKIPRKAKLSAFERCPEVAGYARSAVQQRPYLLPVWQEQRESDRQRGGDGPVLAQPTAGAPGAAMEDATETSETNVQEAGIDEPDVVEAAGGILFSATGSALRAIDGRGDQPVQLGVLDLPDGTHELLLHGRDLLVLTRSWGTEQGSFAGRPTLTLTKVDVSDASSLRVVQSLTTEGHYVSARRWGSTVRVVLSTPPQPIVLPAPAEGEPYKSQAELQQAGVAALSAANMSVLLPDAIVRTADSEDRGLLVGCRRTRHPAEFSGLDVLSILTLDLDKGVDPVDVDAIMAEGDTVYASQDSLYVATSRHVQEGGTFTGTMVTRVHRFSAGAGAQTRYRASGSLPGFVLGQFAFSEHRDVLRVATTERPPWTMDAPGVTESFVTTMDERDGALLKLGRVGGLGPTEEIRAVRFIGDLGYVVTFRRTDPLYVVDLSDPRAPRVRGELKIPGYSSYLHPIGEDLLLGVGQDADERTGAVRGTQISVFDVENPGAPRRIAHQTFAYGSHSVAETDHHAFLWWSKTRTVVLPLTEYGDGGFRGVVAYRVTRANGISEVGRAKHDGGWWDPVQRAVVVGSRLHSLSRGQLVTSRLSDLGRLGALDLEPVSQPHYGPAQPATGAPGPR